MKKVFGVLVVAVVFLVMVAGGVSAGDSVSLENYELSIDSDGAAGVVVEVTEGEYIGKLDYNNDLIEILDVRGADTAIYLDSGLYLSYGSARFLSSQDVFAVVRLKGSVMQPCSLSLMIDDEEQGSLSFLRGDAKADGVVDIADVLFIAQYLAGLRDIGVGLDYVNSVNAASIHQGGTFDTITIQDVLFLAQYLAGLRDAYFVVK